MLERSKKRRKIDNVGWALHRAVRIQSEQSPHAAIALGAGAKRKERTVMVLSVSRKERECFKVGLLLLAV